ncbi:hypothetical protein H6P81_004288 [Aristolochia fimbriata]|uniref:Uncharacterized protein n=1 Tax=Aristolochia fimbriata TaxID=158543 RepID=A0AAV7FEZ6_ARIFI|nr:hypothetical protein H6P81_004288 [Aristolochia fimbriata]
MRFDQVARDYSHSLSGSITVLNTLASHVKIASEKGKTTPVESNILSTKTAIPRTLRWDEIEARPTWRMAEATAPQPLDNGGGRTDRPGCTDWYYARFGRKRICSILYSLVFEKMTDQSFSVCFYFRTKIGGFNTEPPSSRCFLQKRLSPYKVLKGADGYRSPKMETTSTPSTTELLQAINHRVKQGNFANLTLEAVGKQLQQMEGKPSCLRQDYDAKVIYEWNIDNPTEEGSGHYTPNANLFNVCGPGGMTKPIVVNRIVRRTLSVTYMDGGTITSMNLTVTISSMPPKPTLVEHLSMTRRINPSPIFVMSLLGQHSIEFLMGSLSKNETTKYTLHNIGVGLDRSELVYHHFRK